MDLTPQDPCEDSGCQTATSGYSTNHYDYSLSNTQYVETPTIPGCVSRKRKIADCFNVQKSCSFGTPFWNINRSKPPNFLSSTLNDSLSTSLEKCIIGDTPNSNQEEFTPIDIASDQLLKRYRFDDNSCEYQPKTRSAPTTPTKGLDNDLGFPLKSESEYLDYKSFDKKKSFRKHTKLGSPERLELLYPNLKPKRSPVRLKTPEKLREFINKINSPAKKRLFGYGQAERRIIKKVDRDPVSVFWVKNDFRHIIYKIFSYLSDEELCTVSRVSKSWKRALLSDYTSYPRLCASFESCKGNKENLTPASLDKNRKASVISPEQSHFQRYQKVAAQLTSSQSLQKCSQCMQPSVIEKFISQCQNTNCQYISCVKCLSFSISGPENFIDECRTSELILKESKTNYYGLLSDISNLDCLPSLSVNRSQTRRDSSGYLSESDFSPLVQKNLSLSMDMKKCSVLQELNRNIHSATFKRNRRSSLFSVITSNSTPKVELIEPSSPPKVSTIACSKQSKRNLKRLQF